MATTTDPTTSAPTYAPTINW